MGKNAQSIGVKSGLNISLVLVFAVIFVIVSVNLEFTYGWDGSVLTCKPSHETYDFRFDMELKNYKRFSIAVDNEYCSNVGKSMLMINGSAVDAAIAANLCNGLMNAQSAGIGGGHFMLVYLKEKKKAYAINAREKAPKTSFETMFENRSSLVGGLATGIPGEIAGYWEAYKLGGRLPWKTLFEPAIDMCRNGYKVSKSLHKSIVNNVESIRANDILSEVFINATTNEPFKSGDVIKMTRLADTLERIANGDADTFYSGDLAQYMVEEINQNGGNVSLDDFGHYTAKVSQPVALDLDDQFTAFANNIPSGGILAAFIMRIMRKFDMEPSIFEIHQFESLFYHRLIECFKHAYGHRGLLGDEDTPEINQILDKLTNESYVDEIISLINDRKTFPSSFYSDIVSKEDHGTTHISVIADGDAVSLTSSINTYFGAKYGGKHTGIIYNNQMDDFSTPNRANFFNLKPSEANYPKPNKRPMSSMSPLIVLDKQTGQVELVIGASGGSKIITAVAQVAIKLLWFQKTLKDAIDDKRIHHQLYPEQVQIEEGFDAALQKSLRTFGHTLSCFEFGGSVIQAVHNTPMGLFAYSDPRKGGIPAGF